MDESTQQVLALLLVAAVVGLEIWRRWRRRSQRRGGCEGCDSGGGQSPDPEQPLKFYRRR